MALHRPTLPERCGENRRPRSAREPSGVATAQQPPAPARRPPCHPEQEEPCPAQRAHTASLTRKVARHVAQVGPPASYEGAFQPVLELCVGEAAALVGAAEA